MKTTYLWPFGIIAIMFLGSCDKVADPIIPEIELDTTIYPGNWIDYQFPTFPVNSNTQRNVLLEDYTGHRCPNCPDANWIAKGIEDQNSDNVIVVSVHAAPGGLSSFQETASDCGQPSNPNDKYCTEFYCDESIEYGQFFANGYGFFGNPMGTINRIDFTDTEMFMLSNGWAAKTNQVLTENDLKINIQAISNYYPSTNGVYLHSEVEVVEDLNEEEIGVAVHVVEHEAIDWQDSLGTALQFYKHHNILRGSLGDDPWGQIIAGDLASGTKINLDYSYKLPAGYANSDLFFVIYTYNVSTKEIYQVIKHEF
ncbi:MAG: Omp28-related outer membrane protein [Crocinitomicaceae bacterium]